MSRRVATGLIAASLLLAALSVWWLVSQRNDDGSPAASPTVNVEPGDSASESAETVAVTLFFPGDRGLLYPLPRELPLVSDEGEQVAVIVASLLEGPANEELSAPFPEGTRMQGVDVVRDRGAFVALESPPGGSGVIAAGSRQELLMIYSLVNSVVLNVEGIERVGLIWDGVQRPTLAGHVDTRRLLAADPQWLAGE